MLARRKVEHWIAQLEPTAGTPSPPAPAMSLPSPSPLARRLPEDQHRALQKLVHLPDAQIAQLSKAQQEMVQFAKRYDKMLRLTPRQLERLPIAQQQRLQKIQQTPLQSAMASTRLSR